MRSAVYYKVAGHIISFDLLLIHAKNVETFMEGLYSSIHAHLIIAPGKAFFYHTLLAVFTRY
jgi:hypothetical protein